MKQRSSPDQKPSNVAPKKVYVKTPSAKEKARNPDLYFDIYRAEMDFQQEETIEKQGIVDKVGQSKPRVRPMPPRPVDWKEVGGKLFIGED